MKFPYWVRHDGVDYPPYTEIPDLKKAGETVKEEAATEKKAAVKKTTKK